MTTTSNLQTSFVIDKEHNKVLVEREFNAPLSLVWKAWTVKEYLEQWWAPKPWRAESKVMDFREGGYWLYAMVSPENEKHWGRTDYQEIKVEDFYKGTDGFCDEEGVVNPAMPLLQLHNRFVATGGRTKVISVSTYAKAEDLEAVIQMGFEQGFTMALENLDAVLAAAQS